MIYWVQSWKNVLERKMKSCEGRLRLPFGKAVWEWDMHCMCPSQFSYFHLWVVFFANVQRLIGGNVGVLFEIALFSHLSYQCISTCNLLSWFQITWSAHISAWKHNLVFTSRSEKWSWLKRALVLSAVSMTNVYISLKPNAVIVVWCLCAENGITSTPPAPPTSTSNV